MKKNLLIPKVFGAATITAVMIIGVYVFLLDLPKIKKDNSKLTAETFLGVNENQPNNSSLNQSNDSNTTNKGSETQGTNTTAPALSNSTPLNSSTPSNPSTPTTPTAPTTPSYYYKNASFTSSKSYSVPGNNTNTLTATITISNDTITSISTSSVNDAKSQEYNDGFKAEVSAAVVGKKIDPLSVSVLGGASLTSSAFNIILEQIRNLSKK